MSDKSKLIVIGDGVDMYTEYYWGEAFGKNEFDIFNEMFESGEGVIAKILDRIRRVHLSLPLNKKFDLPFKSVWNRSSVLGKYDFEKGTDYTVLFSTVSLHRANPKFVNRLKKKHNLKLACLSIDVFHHEDRMKGAVGRNYKLIDFDLRLNISKEQAEKTGESWIWNPYSKIVESGKKKIERDLYFVGSDGSYRISLLSKFSDFADENGLSKHFLIVPNHDGDLMNEELKKITAKITDSSEYISPRQNLGMATSSRCLVEILRYPISYPTLRYFEAVVYNRRLITTNQDVKYMPFYNPNWIYIIKNEDDISQELLNWIKDESEVDFGYQGEFSPGNFFAELKKRLEEKSDE